MLGCRVFDLLYGAFPLKRWRGYLIRLHTERCPACQEKLAGREEACRLLVNESGLQDIPDLWPAFERRLDEKPGSRWPAARQFWRWAGVAAVLLLAVAALNLWILHRAGPSVPSPSREGEVFNLLSVQVDQKPASAYVFQPKDSPLVLVWVERSP